MARLLKREEGVAVVANAGVCTRLTGRLVANWHTDLRGKGEGVRHALGGVV